jgi:hypothetical protein
LEEKFLMGKRKSGKFKRKGKNGKEKGRKWK